MMGAIMAMLAVAGASAPAPQPKCRIATLIEIPIRMERLRAIATIGIDGHDQRFLVDTGAFRSIILADAAAALGLKQHAAPPGYSIGGVSGQVHVTLTRVDLTLGKTAIPDVEFMVGDFGNFGVQGLLGEDVLGKTDVEYDFANGVVRLVHADDCGKTSLAYWAGDGPVSVVDIRPVSETQHIQGYATINGAPMYVAFDTGTGPSTMTRRAAARAGITPDSPGMTPLGSVRGLGPKTFQSWTASLKSVKVGNAEMRDVRVRIGDFDRLVDLQFGGDFFLSHRVYVANGQHKLYFTCNDDAVCGDPTRTAPDAAAR